MSHLLFVETTGLGVQAFAHAKRRGHTVTYLHWPLYDFTATPDQRGQAIRLADHTASFAERGVPGVGFRVVTDAAAAPEAVEAIGYPVIVKAVLGIGKAVTLIPHDPLAVRAHLAGCTVPSGLPDTDEVALGRYAVEACRALGLRVGAGDVVPPMRPDLDSFGMLHALAPTPAEAEAACPAVKADIEKLSGFPLPAERTRTPAPAA
ncbi:hypothetical protein [Streptomyces sp. NPDC004014]